MQPKIVAVKRVLNKTLASLYEERRAFLQDKHGYAMEKELWHGTSCKALPELLTHGLQPPSDTQPSDSCPRSGRKGLCTTLCGSSCRHCNAAHGWDRCHMYGLGVYLADLAQKSHRYVREPRRESPQKTSSAMGRWQTVLAGKWRSFDAKCQVEFDNAQAAGQEILDFKSRGWNYQLDFKRMVQLNLSTHRERPVRFVEDATEVAPTADDAEKEHCSLPVYSMLRCRVS